MSTILTKEQFKQKYGFDPETGPSTQESTGFDVPQKKIMTRDEFKTQFGFDPESGSDTNNEPEYGGFTKLFKDIGATTDYNVKKGEGSGVGGRRTFGEGMTNIANSLSDVGTGIAKSIVRAPVNLAQTFTPDKMWGENSLLNSESDRANAFREATKGKSGFQKLGATAGDIGQMFIPIGAVGKGVQTATKAIPTLANLASKTGTVGKVARFAPKLAAGLAENALSDAIIGKGQMYNSGGDLVKSAGIGAGAQVGLGLLGKAGRFVKYAGEAGALKRMDDITSEAQKYLKQVENGTADKFVTGALEQAGVDFKKAFMDLAGEAKGKLPEKINQLKARGDGKLAARLEGAFDLENPEGVLDTIWNETGGKINLNDGADTKDLVTNFRYGNETKALAEQQESLIKSRNTTRNIKDIRDSLINRFSREIDSPNEYKKMVDDIDEYVEKLATNKKGTKISSVENAKEVDIFKENKKIRGDFNWEKKGQKQNFKKISQAVDDIIFDSSNPDAAMSREIQTELMKRYDAADLLEALQGVVPKPIIKPWVSQLIGGMAGYATGTGPITSFAAAQAGSKGAQALNKAAGTVTKQGLRGTPLTKAIADIKSADKMNTLRNKIDNAIVTNKTKQSQIKTLRKLMNEVGSELKGLKKDINAKKLSTDIENAKSLREIEKAKQGLRNLIDSYNVNPETPRLPAASSNVPTGFRSTSKNMIPIQVPPGGFSKARIGDSLRDTIR